MYSDTSLLQLTPPAPALRRITSAPIISVMMSTSTAASSIRASSNAPNQRGSALMAGPLPGLPSVRLDEQLLQLRPVFRALLDHAGPARLEGFLAILGRLGVGELDHLDAGGRLLGGFSLVLLGHLSRLRFDPRRS